jgi:hypothetical protein
MTMPYCPQPGVVVGYKGLVLLIQTSEGKGKAKDVKNTRREGVNRKMALLRGGDGDKERRRWRERQRDQTRSRHRTRTRACMGSSMFTSRRFGKGG